MKPNWASTAIKAHLQYQHSICKLYTVELVALADDKDPLLGSGKMAQFGPFRRTHRELHLCLQSPGPPLRLL